MFDHFVPKPPIECPFCGAPTTGWQGKPRNGCALFVWEQGQPSPVDQLVDDECRIPAESLAAQRLEKELIHINYGDCASCSHSWWGLGVTVFADARSGIWSQTVLDPPPLAATELIPEILQCSGCGGPIDVQPRQSLGYCIDCRRLVVRRSSAVPDPHTS